MISPTNGERNETENNAMCWGYINPLMLLAASLFHFFFLSYPLMLLAASLFHFLSPYYCCTEGTL
jgi:hypothetical protein